MGNGALPNGPSCRAHPRLYPFGHAGGGLTMSALEAACVKTRASRECAELFSPFSSFDCDCHCCSFPIQRNRDKISTRKFDVGVFTQAGPIRDMQRAALSITSSARATALITPDSGH